MESALNKIIYNDESSIGLLQFTADSLNNKSNINHFFIKNLNYLKAHLRLKNLHLEKLKKVKNTNLDKKKKLNNILSDRLVGLSKLREFLSSLEKWNSSLNQPTSEFYNRQKFESELKGISEENSILDQVSRQMDLLLVKRKEEFEWLSVCVEELEKITN